MSLFGFYFVTNLLKQAGWPRRKGFVRSLVYDPIVVDGAIDQMLLWSASLAAGRPALSLQMVAEMFRDRGWDGPDSPDIKSVIQGSRPTWDKHPNGSPADVVQPWRLSGTSGKAIPVKQLADPNLIAALEQLCLEAMMWGLGNPMRVMDWYMKRSEPANAEMQGAGLQVDAPLGWDDWLKLSESILGDYERDIQPMPQIPLRLQQDAEEAGVVL